MAMQHLARLRHYIEPVERLMVQADELHEWLSLLEMEYDERTAADVSAQVALLQHEVEQLDLVTLLSGEYDAQDRKSVV